MASGSVKPRREQPVATFGNGGNVLCHCLSLDLKVGRVDERTHALAGVRPDMGQALTIPRVGGNLARALSKLDDLANGVDFVLGHNLIAFDLVSVKRHNSPTTISSLRKCPPGQPLDGKLQPKPENVRSGRAPAHSAGRKPHMNSV